MPPTTTPAVSHSVLNPESFTNPAFQWFREARLGMFIHFSLASMSGKDLGYQHHFKGDYKEYEALAKTFNPTKFSAKAWVDLAEAAGCRYVVPVIKHHEGFCLWNTRTTAWNIVNTPFGRDLLAELAEEVHKRGLRWMIYINQQECHSRFKPNMPLHAWGDRLWKRDDDDPSYEKHRDYICAQLSEILTNYGRVDGIWFDGTTKAGNQWHGHEIYHHIKSIQPNCMVSERAGMGDFATGEWHIDEAEQMRTDRYLAEFCVSVYGNGWGYNDPAYHRSTRACIDMLVRMAGHGVNLLLNVAPDGQGEISAEQSLRMRALGAWLKTNGEAIYGTEALHLQDLPASMRATRKGQSIYVHLREWPELDRLTIPSITTVPSAVRILGLDQAPRIETDAAGSWRLERLPDSPPDINAKVLRLDFATIPHVVRPRPPVRTIHVVPVVTDQATILAVRQADLQGIAYKGWTHSVSQLKPPDAAFAQGFKDVLVETDQANEAGPDDLPRMHAILNWRYIELSTWWNLEVPADIDVDVVAVLRCPRRYAGSRYAVRSSDAEIIGTVQGTIIPDHVHTWGPSWWKGFHEVPFTREPVGRLRLRAGRQTIHMQPTWIEYGCFFADVMALELVPVRQL